MLDSKLNIGNIKALHMQIVNTNYKLVYTIVLMSIVLHFMVCIVLMVAQKCNIGC